MLNRRWTGAVAGLAFLPTLAAAEREPIPLDAREFVIVRRESGPQNYYSVWGDGSELYIRGEYTPPLKTVVLGHKIPEGARKDPQKLRWRWRVRALPPGGDECQKDKGDSAAVVYLVFKHGLKWYTLKYVWSTTSPVHAVCAHERSPVTAQDTVVLESGGPLNEWRTEEIDPSAEFRRYFRDGDPNGHVPDLVGVGLMTDGDATKSRSAADYADFELTPG